MPEIYIRSCNKTLSVIIQVDLHWYGNMYYSVLPFLMYVCVLYHHGDMFSPW